MPKPFPGEVTDLPKDYKFVPMDFPLALNRVGRFTVKLKATDKISKKTSELSFPVRVVDLESK